MKLLEIIKIWSEVAWRYAKVLAMEARRQGDVRRLALRNEPSRRISQEHAKIVPKYAKLALGLLIIIASLVPRQCINMIALAIQHAHHEPS